MKNLQERLNRILESSQELEKRMSHSSVEMAMLRRELKQMKETIEIQKNTIRSLEEKNKIVKIAEAVVLSKDDKRAVKLKINEFIREIDKCIATLSD